MRSKPFKLGLRQRLDEIKTRHLYACECPRRRIAHVDVNGFAGRPGQVWSGTASCHQHRCGRAMRLWFRIKAFAHPIPSQGTEPGKPQP